MLFRKVLIVFKTVGRALAGMAVDFKILTKRWDGGPVFRQFHQNGHQLLVPADKDVGRLTYYFGSFEKEETSYFRQVLKRSDVCVDVGANVGYYTVLMAGLAQEGIVHSFEPQPLNYHLLGVNVSANNLTNVHTNLCALSDHEGEAPFVVAEDPAFSSLVDTGRKKVLSNIQVRIRTLDQYCAECQVPRVDILKVDVEGGEGKVLHGACRLLTTVDRRPRLVMLELNEAMLRKQGSSVEELIALMERIAYRPFVLEGGKEVPFSRQRPGASENAFFAPRAR